MNPAWVVRTGRLVMTPVAVGDLPDLMALKTDPLVFAVMLGGVRTPARVVEELAEEISAWGHYGVGIWALRGRDDGVFHGITGLEARPDGLGMALRFALMSRARGRGLASEAAFAALRFAHERAGLRRVVAVARESNFSSRQVLGSIGMRVCGETEHGGVKRLVFESVWPP